MFEKSYQVPLPRTQQFTPSSQPQLNSQQPNKPSLFGAQEKGQALEDTSSPSVFFAAADGTKATQKQLPDDLQADIQIPIPEANNYLPNDLNAPLITEPLQHSDQISDNASEDNDQFYQQLIAQNQMTQDCSLGRIFATIFIILVSYISLQHSLLATD